MLEHYGNIRPVLRKNHGLPRSKQQENQIQSIIQNTPRVGRQNNQTNSNTTLKPSPRQRLHTGKEEGKQNVTYQVNWKKFKKLNEALEFKKLIAHNLENEQIFKSKSLEEQIVYVTTILTWEQILHLQFNILNILEPKATFNLTLGYVFIHRLYDIYRRWLLDTCKQSRENSQKAFDSLKKKREDFENLLFVRLAEPPQTKH